MSPADTPPEAAAAFTVKELFLEIREGLKEVSLQVQEILQHGSQHARLALEKADKLDQRVDQLELSAASKNAVDRNSKQITTLAITVGVTLLAAVVDGLLHILVVTHR